MLYLNNNILSGTLELTNADTIIKIKTDIDAIFYAKLIFKGGITRAFAFTKEQDYYKSRLVLTKEDSLIDMHLCITTASETTTRESNTIPVLCNQDKIKHTLKIYASRDITDIKITLAQLQKIVSSIAKGKLIENISIKEDTPIEPGMVPMTINNSGDCVFQFPFTNVITEINGQKSVNGAILLTAKDISIEQTDVESAIKAHTEAIKQLNNLLRTISSELKSTKNKVADIEKSLLQHTDSSII